MGLLTRVSNISKDRKGWPWTEETSPFIYDNKINWPKISIVTPSYNQGQFLEETIRSVLLQNYPNLEYIVIDGGSTDNSVEIIKKYEPWITYWVSEKDSGQSEAINKGLALCSGEIFNWLNSDDLLVKSCLFYIAMDFLESSIDVVHYRGYLINGKKEIMDLKGTDHYPTLEELLYRFHIHQPSSFLRLNCVKRVNGVSEDLHYLMDRELWIKYLLLYGDHNVKYCDRPVSYFRFHDSSKTFSSLPKFYEEKNMLLVYMAKCVLNWPEKRCTALSKCLKVGDLMYLTQKDRGWIVNEKLVNRKILSWYFDFLLMQYGYNENDKALIIEVIKEQRFSVFAYPITVKALIKLLLPLSIVSLMRNLYHRIL